MNSTSTYFNPLKRLPSALVAIAVPTKIAVSPRLTSATLAQAYLDYESALWRGDGQAAKFAAWLSAYHCPEMPPRPTAQPDAISPHGAAGRGIAWYDTPIEIRGYGNGAGFRIPHVAVPPDFKGAVAP